MTAVANPHSFANLNRPAWGVNGGQTLNPMNPDEVRGMFAPRKSIQRTNSSSSVASSSSTSSTGTVTSAPQTSGSNMPAPGDPGGWPNAAPRKRPQPKGQWPAGKPEGQPGDFVRMPAGRPPMVNGVNGVSSAHQPSSILSQGQMMSQGGLARPGTDVLPAGAQPVLYLLSLNGTFERKTISVPFYPDTLRIGRQTNAKTVPTPVNGFFDSKVLSRQHAEIWADRSGKISIRDVKSSNGTFVNGTRLSPENRESEPHELQTQDHLELGIDIVSEDQKTVVHHKVAAKVEHAGFATPSSSLPDMNFGDLDSSTGIPQLGGMPFRGITGSQTSINARMGPAAGVAGAQAAGLAHQRQYWISPVTTEHIVKRLQNEMRNARLQSQDLNRTGQFINALLSKDEIKNQDKPEVPEPPKAPAVNGTSALSFRSESGKTRFSDPPAPPPSQPLPEKPDVARPHNSEVPSLKRGVTERPKSHPANPVPPVRQDLSQIIQLTEALNNAKREIDNHSARVRELEELFQKEREARLQAEDKVHKMEETKSAKINGSAELPKGHSELDKAFDPPVETPLAAESGAGQTGPEDTLSQPDRVEAAAAIFQAQIDSMVLEMKEVREQLDSYKTRAEKAEAERDASQQTLAEMVMEIRKRDEEEKRSAERKSRSLSKGRKNSPRPVSRDGPKEATTPNGSAAGHSGDSPDAAEGSEDAPTLSRANTIKPSTGELSKATNDQALIQGLPYASMIGVVLLGMGLMAYINGWQPRPSIDR